MMSTQGGPVGSTALRKPAIEHSEAIVQRSIMGGLTHAAGDAASRPCTAARFGFVG
jgi:hypothetical protein